MRSAADTTCGSLACFVKAGSQQNKRNAESHKDTFRIDGGAHKSHQMMASSSSGRMLKQVLNTAVSDWFKSVIAVGARFSWPSTECAHSARAVSSQCFWAAGVFRQAACMLQMTWSNTFVTNLDGRGKVCVNLQSNCGTTTMAVQVRC